MSCAESTVSETPIEDLREYVGKTGPERGTRDDVNQPMIRHWCDAMTDRNPVYTDREFAATSSHAGIVAPPTMLDTWAMPGLGSALQKSSDAKRKGVSDRVFAVLDDAGFTSVVATNTSHEYRRYLRPGDRLRIRQTFTDVSAEKQTALGTGHFVTWVTEYFDQDDKIVGSVEFRVLKFKPGTGRVALQAAEPATASPVLRPRPGISRDTKFFWDGIDQGELRIQTCDGCGALHHPPMVRCPDCGAYDLGYVVSKGRGKVYSFVEVHYPQIPAFDYPLLVVLVELDEGTRILSNLVGVSADQVAVGMPVELAIQTVDPELNLPLFRRARPPRRETTLNFEDVAAGETLAPCPVAITPTLIVAGAMASRDFQDVHHDVELARKRGSPNIFMNIMTTGGLIGRYVTDWAGPEAILRGLTIRLGVPNYPGDTMTLIGEVSAADVRDGKGIVEIGVRGTNRLGDHASGSVELELPLGRSGP
jgi:uncharacterized OB-fold protein/acyl dehydratase